MARQMSTRMKNNIKKRKKITSDKREWLEKYEMSFKTPNIGLAYALVVMINKRTSSEKMPKACVRGTESSPL